MGGVGSDWFSGSQGVEEPLMLLEHEHATMMGGWWGGGEHDKRHWKEALY